MVPPSDDSPKSLGDGATGSDVEPSEPSSPQSLGDQSTTGDMGSSISDLVDVGDGFGGFDLRKQVGAVVGARQRVLEIEHPESHAPGAGVEPPRAERRVLAVVDDHFRLGGIVDHRHQQNAGSRLQRPQDVMAFAVRQAHERKDTARFCRQTQGLDALEIGRPVLDLNPDRLKADMRRQTYQQRRAAVDGYPADPPRLSVGIYEYIVLGIDGATPL